MERTSVASWKRSSTELEEDRRHVVLHRPAVMDAISLASTLLDERDGVLSL
jgi:hypothetical protein